MEAIDTTPHVLPMDKTDYEAYVTLMIRRLEQTEHILHKRVHEEVQSLIINHAHLHECLNK